VVVGDLRAVRGRPGRDVVAGRRHLAGGVHRLRAVPEEREHLRQDERAGTIDGSRPAVLGQQDRVAGREVEQAIAVRDPDALVGPGGRLDGERGELHAPWLERQSDKGCRWRQV